MVDLQEIEINIYPSQLNQIISDDQSISIEIEPTPERDSVEGIFNLELDGNSVIGDFLWDENQVSFYPLDGWRWGEKYKLTLNGEISTQGDLEYTVKISNYFYVETDEIPLLVDVFSPESESITDIYTPIEISFNKEVDQESFYQQFSLTPSTELNIEWNDDSTIVTITPKDKWVANRRYNWKINEELQAKNGQHIRESQSFYFLTNQDSFFDADVELTLVSYERDSGSFIDTSLPIEQISYQDQLLLHFSEDVDMTTLENALDSSPEINLDIIILSNSQVILFPNEIFNPQENYRITLSEDLQDIAGNPLREELSWNIHCANIYYQEILSIESASDGIIYDNVTMPPENGLQITENAQEKFITFTINFSQPINDPEKQYQFVMNDIQMKDIFPATLGSLELIYISWEDSSTLHLQFDGFQYSQDLTIDRSNYRLLVSGGNNSTTTETGAYLQDDFILDFHTGLEP
jgi:hypothetical protein